MKYLIDTADVNEIRKWKYYVEGVTTNPILLNKINIKSFLEEMDGIKENFNVFIQVHTLKEYDDLVLIKRTLHLKNNIIAKIPLMYSQGYELLKKIKEIYKYNSQMLIPITGTITYDLIQLHQAFELGCDYCIVLIHKNENPLFLEEALKLRKTNSNYNRTKLIGASFRTKDEISRALLSGIQYATLSPKTFKLIFNNEQTNKDWREIYGN